MARLFPETKGEEVVRHEVFGGIVDVYLNAVKSEFTGWPMTLERQNVEYRGLELHLPRMTPLTEGFQVTMNTTDKTAYFE